MAVRTSVGTIVSLLIFGLGVVPKRSIYVLSRVVAALLTASLALLLLFSAAS